MPLYIKYFLVLTRIVFLLPLSSLAADWPKWLGPNGDSVWRESGVISSIPKDGLKTRWEREVGLGYSGPSVANGKVYLGFPEKPRDRKFMLLVSIF